MEYKKKCNVCGKIFCYTDEDLKNSAKNAGLSALEALGSLASLGGGTIFHTQYLTSQSDRYADKVVDFNQCPYCRSRDLSYYTGEMNDPAIEAAPQVKAINISSGASTEALLKRTQMFLEDGDWDSATAYCEACLDKDPENAQAYLLKSMVEFHISHLGDIPAHISELEQSPSYKRFLRWDTSGMSQQFSEVSKQLSAEIQTKQAAYIQNSLRTTKMQGLLSSSENCITYGVTSDGRLIRTASQVRRGSYSLFPLNQSNVKAVASAYGSLLVLDWNGNVTMYGKHKSEDSVPGIAAVHIDFSDWHDIDEIYNSNLFVLGRTKDGRVLHQGRTDHGIAAVNEWRDIIQISAHSGYALGLKADGTVVAAGDGSFGRTSVSDWKDIVMVAAGGSFAYGLKADGTVLATKYNSSMNPEHGTEDQVEAWRDIIQISAGEGCVAGLAADGTVISAGSVGEGGTPINDWHNVTAVVAGNHVIFGICKDGSVVASGDNSNICMELDDSFNFKKSEFDKGRCDVEDWRLFDEYENYDQELFEIQEQFRRNREAKARAAIEEKRKTLEKEKVSIQEEIPKIKGLFAAGKIKKAEARLAEIEDELVKLEQVGIK